MYRRRKKITKKTVIIGIVVVIIMISLSILLPRNNYINNSILKDITITINKIVMFPFTTLNTEKNINHNESYLIQKNVNESLEKEIQELKEALELNKTFLSKLRIVISSFLTLSLNITCIVIVLNFFVLIICKLYLSLHV